MNIASNPWSFVSADAVTSTPTAITNNANGTVSVTTSAAHNLVEGNHCTLIGNTPANYNQFYYVIAAPSGTTLTLLPQTTPLSGIGNGTVFGTVAKNQYSDNVRIEDMSWQNASAAAQLLDMRDRNGLVIWQATATGAGSQNRGKLFWVSGITLIQLQSGVVIVTVD